MKFLAPILIVFALTASAMPCDNCRRERDKNHNQVQCNDCRDGLLSRLRDRREDCCRDRKECTHDCRPDCRGDYRRGYRQGFRDGCDECRCQDDWYVRSASKGMVGSAATTKLAKDWWPWPTPAPSPQPDPSPPAPEPPPAPPSPSIPSDPKELNAYIAQHLGGYVRANIERNGLTLDIYQARGTKRISWTVAEAKDWQCALGKAAYNSGVSAAPNGVPGLALICDAPHEPTPTPAELPENKILRAHGGTDLEQAEVAARAAGAWLVIVHRYGGEVNRIIYNP